MLIGYMGSVIIGNLKGEVNTWSVKGSLNIGNLMGSVSVGSLRIINYWKIWSSDYWKFKCSDCCKFKRCWLDDAWDQLLLEISRDPWVLEVLGSLSIGSVGSVSIRNVKGSVSIRNVKGSVSIGSLRTINYCKIPSSWLEI